MLLKTIFDFLLAIILLPILLPIIIILVLCSTLDTGKFGLFSQPRIGKNARVFNIYKIRSMKGDYDSDVTTEKTHHITDFGSLIRRTKLDELPQIFNILLGHMSFVGPRPDVAGYADQLKGDDRIVLTVKPGITGPAQLAYRDEDELLNEQDDPVWYNDEVLWPKKVEINKAYVKNRSFWGDIGYIFRTVF